MNKMNSFSVAGMKKAPALVPLIVIVGGGALFSSYYVFRLATKCPDVSWDPKKNPEPWQQYANKQYKFWSSKDYSELPSVERPKF